MSHARLVVRKGLYQNMIEIKPCSHKFESVILSEFCMWMCSNQNIPLYQNQQMLVILELASYYCNYMKFMFRSSTESKAFGALLQQRVLVLGISFSTYPALLHTMDR
jgi:hypothetical protein